MTEPGIEIVRRAYPRLAKELVGGLLEVLDEAARAFDGDLGKFHILLAIALRSAAHPDIAQAAADLAAGRDVELPSLWTNVHSIALSLGVPEETARRKVNALVKQGWLERQDHSVRYTAKAARELSPLRLRIIRMAVANHHAVDKALNVAPASSDPT